MKKLDIMVGTAIDGAVARALAESIRDRADVCFDFNGVTVVVAPADTLESVVKRFHKQMDDAHEELVSSPEYKAAQEKAAADLRARMAAPMKEKASSEAEMRETESPWPLTMAQLTEYVESVTARPHDYGTCIYAMSLGALAAFNYVAGKLGVSGFQSSCADLDFLRRNRGIKGPFILLRAEDALYPQYDLPERLSEALREWQPWLAEQAVVKLQETPDASPRVKKHWRRLASK